MSLDYTISNRNQTGNQNIMGDINTPYKWKTGWYTELLKKYPDLTADQLDARITDPAEKYAYEHDIANYGWVTNKDGTKSYEADKGTHALANPSNYKNTTKDPVTQRMYQQELQGSGTATQSHTGTQQASQSVFDTSASRYAPSHQNIINF